MGRRRTNRVASRQKDPRNSAIETPVRAQRLAGYLPGPWLQVADCTSLERVNASEVSGSDRQRQGNRVWPLKVGKRWVWVCLVRACCRQPKAGPLVAAWRACEGRGAAATFLHPI
jgi:NADH:ubiquinone oxidoreductase subunit E